jgi:hypothetical protein
MSAKSQQSQRQPIASPRRRSSDEDANWAPPRYSSLGAAFVENLSADQTEAVPVAPDFAPPRYSSVISLIRTSSVINLTRTSGVFNLIQTRTRRSLAHPASDNRVAWSSPGNTPPDSPVTPDPSGLQVHEYYINSGGEIWATLKVMSRTSVGSTSSASSSLSSTQRVPRFTGSDFVQGILELNLETPQNINSIRLSVCFFSLSKCNKLWDFNVAPTY